VRNGGSRQRRGGFTLIEMLVVIAIIAILAAIILPVYFQARGKARQTHCLSNLKQIGAGLTTYADDNDGYYTRGQFWPWDGSHLWTDAVEPYLKNKDILRCPDQGSDAYGYGYNISWWGTGDVPDGMHGIQDWYPVHQSQVAEPAETVWVVDFGRYWGCGLEFGIEKPPERHHHGFNVLFVDGHTKWLKEVPDRMWTVNAD
jgi:prepilin-type N-terminal cleavage/methylation domain-containing protein/prepilin-type processing-associated H-X9-DG protein